MGVAWRIDTLQSCRAWTLCASTLRKKEKMGRQGELAASLLILVLMAYISEAGNSNVIVVSWSLKFKKHNQFLLF